MPRTRRERGHSGGAFRSLRSRVFLEETFCFLCGYVVDKMLHHLDDGAPQLHYVIPLTQGGNPRDRQNARLTHRYCNNKQGNKMPGEVDHSGLPNPWIDGLEP